MRTSPPHRSRGVGSRILEHIIAVAERRGYRHLYLETGAMPEFAAARRLYQRHGFVFCEPFAPYRPDPNSVFMVKRLASSGRG
jgi:putative acetyltransferase